MGDQADQYADQFDVTRETASRRLSLQEKALDISDALQKRLGGRFAGVWFDNEVGEFVVPLPTGADEPAVEREFESRGLAQNYRTTTARSTESELVKAQERLYEQIGDLLRERYVRLGIDTQMNAVVIDLARGASLDERPACANPSGFRKR